jgi:hypothetical protein
MSRWITIALASGCGLWALWQCYMTWVYIKVAKSAPADPDIPVADIPVTFATHRSIRSALTFCVLTGIIFFALWPKMLLFVTAVLVLRVTVNILMFRAGAGMYCIYLPDGIDANGRSYALATQVSKLLVLTLAFFVVLFFTMWD